MPATIKYKVMREGKVLSENVRSVDAVRLINKSLPEGVYLDCYSYPSEIPMRGLTAELKKERSNT